MLFIGNTEMDKLKKNQRIKEKRKKCFWENTVEWGNEGEKINQPRKEKEAHSYENNLLQNLEGNVRDIFICILKRI